MNVIIANKYKDALSSLNVDVIKRMDGEFDVDTLIDNFTNFYFNRMILDITAIKDYFNIAVIQKLCANLDASKIILFLTDDPRINNIYLSRVISLGIYNFTRELTGITYLMDNPNGYKDVAQYHDLALNDERNLTQSYNQPMGGGAPKNNNIYGFNNDGPVNNENTLGMGAGSGSTLVLGFKDLTPDAGATTLVYMLKKQLKNKKVLAVEINANDFTYFNDGELMSVPVNQIDSVRSKFSQFEYVFIDLNNSNLDLDGTCTDVIYLLEPSTIKLNSLMRRDRQALERVKDRKIVLNKSLLTVSDVSEFEYEAKMKMFYNIPPLDERKDHQMILDSFLEKLGIYNDGEAASSNKGIFNIFKN